MKRRTFVQIIGGTLVAIASTLPLSAKVTADPFPRLEFVELSESDDSRPRYFLLWLTSETGMEVVKSWHTPLPSSDEISIAAANFIPVIMANKEARIVSRRHIPTIELKS